ncbi:hypothetical protein [Paenibacillus macerans]|uniref:hypothetical protein n=1 Tax=Paenibacillus macerans TaxID=44252 RepID=UPI003D321199
MANKILITDTYHDEIRGRLGIGEDVLSNADIDAPSVLPIGESKVISSVPNYEDLTGDDRIYLYAAAICMVAAIIAPSMTARFKKAKKDFDFSYENQTVNWNKLAEGLFDESYGYINEIPNSIRGSDVPVIRLAGPTRLKEMERRHV